MNVKLLTIESMPSNCTEVLGMISASICLSKSLVGDVSANFKNWTVGGELNMYTNLIDQSIEVAQERILEKARKINAKAVIGIRLSTTQVSEGAAEIIIYGTAVR